MVQVSSRTASAAAQSAVARLSKGKAALALELIGYNSDLGAAMKYAFGNAFVCKVRCASASLAPNECTGALSDCPFCNHHQTRAEWHAETSRLSKTLCIYCNHPEIFALRHILDPILSFVHHSWQSSIRTHSP